MVRLLFEEHGWGIQRELLNKHVNVCGNTTNLTSSVSRNSLKFKSGTLVLSRRMIHGVYTKLHK